MTLTSKQEDDMLEAGRDKTELKTLKDINQPRLNYKNVEIYKENLRQEAIKRWKYFNYLSITALQERDFPSCYSYAGRASEIMDFFNLTEDDLK